MPRQLTNLRIDEVSSVDKGAGHGVKVLLMKRQQPEAHPDDVAHKALTLAIGSIMADGGKAEDFVECFKQFHSYLKGDEPKETEMTPDEINKLVAEAVAKALEEAEKKKKPATPANAPSSAGTVGGKQGAPDTQDDGDSAADDASKSLSDAAAKELLDKLGIKLEKNEPKKVEKAADTEIAKRDEKIVSLEKHVAALVEKEQKIEFGKRAVSIGLTEADGDHIRKAYLGDVKSLDFLCDTIAKLNKQVEKAGLFGEVGSGGGAAADAHSALLAKAAEIAKSAAATDKPLTEAQAYVKALATYPDLAKQEKAEREARLLKHA